MEDDFSVPGLERSDDDAPPTPPEPDAVEPVQQDRYAMPLESETEWGTADPVVEDRYLLPEEDQLVPTYVRNEAPWVGFSSSIGAPPIPSDEPEFTRIVRQRRRWKETIAWVVTGAFIVTAAWFLPILLAPTSQLGRVGFFAALALGGIVALAVLWRTWRWAHVKD
jgi:hypothetical protein